MIQQQRKLRTCHGEVKRRRKQRTAGNLVKTKDGPWPSSASSASSVAKTQDTKDKVKK